MCGDIFVGDDGNEWIRIKGRAIPKKQLDEVDGELLKFVIETEDEFNKKRLNWRGYEKFRDDGEV